jgi:hypothetical protein
VIPTYIHVWLKNDGAAPIKQTVQTYHTYDEVQRVVGQDTTWLGLTDCLGIYWWFPRESIAFIQVMPTAQVQDS